MKPTYELQYELLCKLDEPICPVCDDAPAKEEFQGCCSDDCLTTAVERQHEGMCEDYYGGSSPVTVREHAEFADRKERPTAPKGTFQ